MNNIVVMGVCGSGKSTIAAALAKRLGGIYRDGDDFHPESNRQKMASGIPLDDDDRQGWLDQLAQLISSHDDPAAGPLCLACSALRKAYRDRLRQADDTLQFIFLYGTEEQLAERLQGRDNHFMPAALLRSQLSTLEPPKHAIQVNIKFSVDEIVNEVARQIETPDDPFSANANAET